VNKVFQPDFKNAENPRMRFFVEILRKTQQGVLRVKSIYLPAIAIAALVFLSTPSLVPAVEGNAQRVALLDIGRVFENHAAFNQAMESMQAEVDQFRARIEQEQAKIQTMAEELRGASPDDPRAIQLEAQLTKMTADLQVEHQLKNKEFVQREAKLYYQTYVDVSSKVSAFCDQNNISLVLRHAELPTEDKSPQSVLETINNPVVFERNQNITEQIIRAVNGPSAQQALGPAQPSR
jgi:Skp family chaperone for outer membrane proteins